VKRFVAGSEARESKKNDGSQTRNRDSAEAREENGGGRTAAAQVELVRVYGLRERRERQGRAQRYREETRASRARLGEPSRAPRRRPHRASGRSIPFAGHHPVGAGVEPRARRRRGARGREPVRRGEGDGAEDADPPELELGGRNARVSNGARGRATRGETFTRSKKNRTRANRA